MKKMTTHLFLFIFMFLWFLFLAGSSSFAEVPAIKITADTLTYADGIYTAKGNVVIHHANRVLRSSEVILDNNSGELNASGKVELEDGDNRLSSENLYINMRTSYTSIDNGKMFIKEDNYHIEGEKIERLSEDRFRIKKAVFTTCDGDIPCWRFKGNNINIRLNHFFTAKHVSVSVKNFPVLYIPYIVLPIVQERQTGLLIPRIGYNTNKGLKLNNAFYWAISESKDATIYADYYAEKGWGGGLEYRYVYSKDTGGQFNGYYLNDNQVNRNRWDIKYQHRQVIADNLSAKLRVNHLNDEAIDETLYKVISEDVGERLQRTQDSDLYVSRRWDHLSSHLWAQYTQNLDPAGDGAGIYQRLPEAGVNVMDTRAGKLPVYYNLTSSASRWEEEDTGLTRLFIAPALSARFAHKGFVFIPKAGIEQTFYYYDGNTAPVHSNLYELGASLSTKFFRSFNTGHSELLHFVEPVLSYKYADGDKPEAGGKKLDLVEESGEKNEVSFAIISRVVSMHSDKKYEPFYLRLAQIYYVNPDGPEKLERRFSDTRMEAVLRLNEVVSVDADTVYSHDQGTFISFNTDLKVTGDSSYLNAGQRYSRDSSIRSAAGERITLEFFTAEAGIVMDNISNSIGIWYDNNDHIMRETNYTFKYMGQCWGISLSYKYRPDEEQYSVLLNLKGLGSVGRI
ncbi:MAG TPA: LPS assembly protein LptD [Nitrospirota bacterium]|nr:LPS assembly protein LptD [Nitrospirota bacterium]